MKKRKIALVTGGSRGLGKDMAISLAKKNIDVILTYHSKKEEAEAVVSEINKLGTTALALQLDTSNIKSFDSFFAQIKAELKGKFDTESFDFLINNAGIGIMAPFSQTTEDQFDTLTNIHFKGVYFLTQKALSLLNDGGRIINISSGLARFTLPGFSVYGSLKGAIETLTKYLAKELGSRFITVNAIAPGAIATDFGNGSLKTNVQAQEYMKSVTAIPRVGQPEDIGGVVAFLCSDEAGWINAQTIEVSGGMNI